MVEMNYQQVTCVCLLLYVAFVIFYTMINKPEHSKLLGYYKQPNFRPTIKMKVSLSQMGLFSR